MHLRESQSDDKKKGAASYRFNNIANDWVSSSAYYPLLYLHPFYLTLYLKYRHACTGNNGLMAGLLPQFGQTHHHHKINMILLQTINFHNSDGLLDISLQIHACPQFGQTHHHHKINMILLQTINFHNSDGLLDISLQIHACPQFGQTHHHHKINMILLVHIYIQTINFHNSDGLSSDTRMGGVFIILIYRNDKVPSILLGLDLFGMLYSVALYRFIILNLYCSFVFFLRFSLK
ncbi:hypothetical protein ACJX0J_029516 [Zea mays]